MCVAFALLSIHPFEILISILILNNPVFKIQNFKIREEDQVLLFFMGFIFSFPPLKDGTFTTSIKLYILLFFFLQDESIGIDARYRNQTPNIVPTSFKLPSKIDLWISIEENKKKEGV
jgi:hypothetical protein